MPDERSCPVPRELNRMLRAWGGGDREALDRLTPLVVQELKRIAQRHMRGEYEARSTQATALVNETWLRLVEVDNVLWQDRAQFFGICARIMGRILVDAAPVRLAAKRGGGALQVTFDESLPAVARESQLVRMDEALQELAAVDPRKEQVVELRFFGGLSVSETAHVLGVSEQTVHRDWRLAPAWLLEELSRPTG